VPAPATRHAPRPKAGQVGWASRACASVGALRASLATASSRPTPPVPAMPCRPT
jgi:hypothetical protein